MDVHGISMILINDINNMIMILIFLNNHGYDIYNMIFKCDKDVSQNALVASSLVAATGRK